jgi:parvulin-like peptidyl-prolyl isomerase
MTKNQSLLLFVFSTAFAWTPAPAQSEKIPAGIVAKAGDLYISEREFVERFELLPALQRSRKSRIEESKMELIYSMIAERLLSQEARQRGLARDSVFRSEFEEIRKVLARDELYRQEVSGKANVSAKDIELGIDQAFREILIAFLYFEREDAARFVRRQIVTPADFDRLQIDPGMGGTRDTATVIWGDADPAIEQAAYMLRENEVSPVIAAGAGYYILKLRGIKRNALFGALDPSVLRERVRMTLRERKEKQRLNEFVGEALRGRTGYARAQQLKILARAMEDAFARTDVSGTAVFDENRANQVRESCLSVLDDTLAVAGPVVLSVRQTIQRLQDKGFSIDSVGIHLIGQRLNTQVKIWVQQELLEQESIARKLDQVPGVARQLETWYESLLAQQMKSYIKRQVRVTEPEIMSAMRASDSGIVIPRVQVREVRTSTLDDMQRIIEDLDKGESMEHVCLRWNSDAGLRARKGVSDFFPISERYPIGDLAWEMQIGQRYGPLQVGKEFVYFELLAKDSTGFRDSTERTSRAAALNELRRQKEKRLLNLFLAKSGEQRGFMIYQDRLERLKLSALPMMTFRVLGFGGRMFAVPFVDPLIDWIGVESQAGQINF